jgi:hypothetical protein
MRISFKRNSALIAPVGVLIVLAGALGLALPARLAAQTRTNLAGSVTSESMTALWVARERGLFKKHGLDMQFILMPRNPLAISSDRATLSTRPAAERMSSASPISRKNLTSGSPLDPKSKTKKTFAASESPLAVPAPRRIWCQCWLFRV